MPTIPQIERERDSLEMSAGKNAAKMLRTSPPILMLQFPGGSSIKIFTTFHAHEGLFFHCCDSGSWGAQKRSFLSFWALEEARRCVGASCNMLTTKTNVHHRATLTTHPMYTKLREHLEVMSICRESPPESRIDAPPESQIG